MSTEKQKKVNQIACKAGMVAMLWSFKVISSAFHLQPKQISNQEMNNFVKNITSGQRMNYISLADSYYYIIPWATFKEILDYLKVELNKIPYIKEVVDCDNLSYLVSVLISVIFKINTCGVVHGRVNIGHFWNGIVAEKEDGTLGLFYYDLKKVSYTEYKKGDKIIIGNWTYIPDSYHFF